MAEGYPGNLLPFRQSVEMQCSVRMPPSNDPRARSVQAQLERFAPSGATVLIIGETGTGKELAARRLHELSRRHGPFVAVNCGAFSESLVEAEFFGHEAAAFTGAQQARAGWFEAAEGGTLFLDEIGDMPPFLQVKLLRVLQERQVVRIGSRKPIAVDVRVVAATNIELDAAMQAGRFRSDLYYRLNVATLRMPPLRERRGDIVPLAEYFTALYGRRFGQPDVRLSAAAARALEQYHWPGNVRELENTIQAALLMSSNGLIQRHDLRLPTVSGYDGCEPGGSQDDALLDVTQVLGRWLDGSPSDAYETIERLLLTVAFQRCGGNQVRTARCLGISRNVVRAQLKRFGLLPGDTDGAAESTALHALEELTNAASELAIA